MSYLLEIHGADKCKSQGVAIGYDGRHNSFGFANLAAATFHHHGFKIYLTDKKVATPLIPFYILKCKCLAGLVITASHCSKEYNGYKVQWDNGSQILPEHEKAIEQKMAEKMEVEEIQNERKFQYH